MNSFYRKYGFIIAIAVAFIITIIAYSAFSKTEHFQTLLAWSNQNLPLLIIILVALKIIGIIWPPLPGLVFTLGAIPIIGWEGALLTDLAGGIIGSSSVFWISRKYGKRVIWKIFGESGVYQVERIKFNSKNELEALIIMRLFGGPVSELVSYGAGVSNVSYFHFILGTTFAHFVVILPLFYLASLAFNNGGLFFSIIPLFIGVVIMYVLRKRYFILED